MSRALSVRNLFVFLVLALPLLALTACNTTEGFGEDMQAGGRAIERSAK
jgi:predicted small secreted protein